ncbi:Pol polyprotein [Plakobranchus ocellatus]|uniref:Pol polyprotein n=1 Tax=Plakobranchus ocellatus TaxID=259542 RepID=A0AAV3YF98_9GAST|nr:Pol polyprotein [Plakobranchus ocellatus]
MGNAVRVHTVRAPRKEKTKFKSNPRQPPLVPKQQQKQSQAQAPRSYHQKYCPNCGNLPHHQLQCPARGQVCNYCRKKNHFKKMCRKLKFSKKKTHNIDLTSDSDDEYEDGATCSFETIQFNSVETTDDEAYVILNVKLPNFPDKKTTLKAQIDTGSQGNVLPMRLYEKMFPDGLDRLHKSRTKITAYGGSQVKNYGTCQIQCSYKKLTGMATFYVTEDTGTAIIGLPSLQAMKIVNLNHELKMTQQRTVKDKEHLIKEYPEVFRGIGKFQGTYDIHLDQSVPPSIHPPRKDPLKLKDKINSELDKMTNLGIIEKIKEGEPTEWVNVNSLVYREKANGRLRLCLDPKDLNRAILREHHKTPTLEEILPNLSGAKYFSILDAKCGYWNVVLDKESSRLTTFNSPFGRYKFLRMPFGLKMSQDIFQSRIDQTFEGCSGVIGIADDIVVSGKTEKEHDNNLRKMIQRCEETGLKLNPDKCRIKQEQIKFYGVICCAKGLKPDPEKVESLQNMKATENVKELQSFLGLTTYMSPFIPNSSSHTAPLRELLLKSSKFEWTPNHEKVFKDIKDSISKEVTLAYFNPDKSITVQVDASMKALGASLIQEVKPVAFASKALTDEETRYANIARKPLALVYGCERFHTYLYGQAFTVESDHKPLKSIHLKHLRATPPRLQHTLLRLQPYDLTIAYKPGKEMALADALSRLTSSEDPPIKGLNVKV